MQLNELNQKTDNIEQENLERRKNELWFAFKLRDLHEYITSCKRLRTRCGCELYSLGVDLVKTGRVDVLPILAKMGDDKAKQRKIRTQLPRDLVGKSVEWIRVSDVEYKVLVKGDIDTKSHYEHLAQQLTRD